MGSVWKQRGKYKLDQVSKPIPIKSPRKENTCWWSSQLSKKDTTVAWHKKSKSGLT